MWPGPLGEFSGKNTSCQFDMSLHGLDYVDIFMRIVGIQTHV